MNVSRPAELADFVKAKVSAGRYSSWEGSSIVLLPAETFTISDDGSSSAGPVLYTIESGGVRVERIVDDAAISITSHGGRTSRVGPNLILASPLRAWHEARIPCRANGDHA